MQDSLMYLTVMLISCYGKLSLSIFECSSASPQTKHWTAKARKVEVELEEVREKLAEVKKELEECQRKSWAVLPSTKFLPRSLEAKDKYLTIRQSVPPETFSCSHRHSNFPYMSNSHKLVDKMRIDGDYRVRLVEEESSASEWPPLPRIILCVGRGDENFDKNNWWYLKTTHSEGGLTMFVYYDGNRSQISHNCWYGSDDDPIIPLPFSEGILEVYSYTHTFSLFRMDPFGVRFGFAYRPCHSLEFTVWNLINLGINLAIY